MENFLKVKKLLEYYYSRSSFSSSWKIYEKIYNFLTTTKKLIIISNFQKKRVQSSNYKKQRNKMRDLIYFDNCFQ